jgi:hypothetical protein
LDASSQYLCHEDFAPFIPGAKIMWFVLIMAGGNVAMLLYVLLQLFGLRPDKLASALFRQEAA